MNIHKILDHPRFRLEKMNPAGDEAMQDFLSRAPDNLPVKYLHFMQASDGAKGKVPYDSGFIEIWPVKDTMDQQAGYGNHDSLAGFFAFGSDGSGRDYLFDLRENDGAAVYCVPREKPEPEHLEHMAGSFSQFLQHIALMGSGA